MVSRSNDKICWGTSCMIFPRKNRLTGYFLTFWQNTAALPCRLFPGPHSSPATVDCPTSLHPCPYDWYLPAVIQPLHIIQHEMFYIKSWYFTSILINYTKTIPNQGKVVNLIGNVTTCVKRQLLSHTGVVSVRQAGSACKLW